MIELCRPDYPINYDLQKFTFNGGEEFLKIDYVGPSSTGYQIRAHIESSKDVMQLLMLTDAVKRIGTKYIELFIPYFPYARQDRVMTPGESLSVKVMADLINAQKYDRVTIWDAHSDVTPALVNNVEHVAQDYLAYIMLKNWSLDDDNCVLVAPDAGAIKKVTKLAQRADIDMVRADKLRDVRTGEIKETIVYSEHVGDKNFLIVDDICDGGRTFTELAAKLRPLTNKDIILYVTHGIFSQGLRVFEGLIDAVYCPNVFEGGRKVDLREGYTGIVDFINQK